MDLSQAGVERLESARMYLTLPNSIDKIDDGKGDFQWIEFASPDSDTIKRIDDAFNQRVSGMQRKAGRNWSPPNGMVRSHIMDKVCGAVLNWNLHYTFAAFPEAGDHPPCNPEYVRAFFSEDEPLGPHFRDEAWDFIQARTNFLLQNKKPSSNTLASSSGLENQPQTPPSPAEPIGTTTSRNTASYTPTQPWNPNLQGS